MADTEISRLPELAVAAVDKFDALAIADISASETKKILALNLVEAGIINLPDDTIDPGKIDWDSADAVIDGSALVNRSVAAVKLQANTLTAAEIAPNAIGASELANNAVDTAAIADNAVTAAKISANAVGASEIANGSVGTNELADTSVTYVKTNFTNGSIPGAKIAANSLTADQIAANSIGASELANNAVDTAAVANDAITNAKIASGAVNSDSIQNGTIATADLANGAVTYAKTNFANGSIPGNKIQGNSLTAAQIAPNAIGASELANNSVDTAALATNSVTSAKIANNAVGSTEIVDGAVSTSKLDDEAVTYAKTNFADGDIPGAKITGNSLTAGQIAANAIGASELANNAVDTAAIANLAVTTAKLANGNVTTGKIDSNAVTTEKIADGAVTYSKLTISDNQIPGSRIVSNSVTALQIAPNAVGASELADNAVDAAAIASGAVGTSEIAGEAVTTTRIANDAVTQAKIGPEAVGTDEIELLAVNTPQLANDAVTPAKLANNLPASILATGSITSAYLADEAVTTSKLDDSSVTTEKLASSSVTDLKILNVDGSKLVPDSVEASKFDPAAFSDGIVLDGTVRHSNQITAATASGISWDAQGHIIGSVDLDADDMPIATDSQLGAIIVPAGSGLTVNAEGEIDHRTLIDAGLMSGITYDEHGHITATRALISSDLPPATNTVIGAVSVPTADSNPLVVNGAGALTHSESVITPGVYASLEVDQYGHAISGSGVLTPGQVPGLDASKITTGEFSTAFIADNAITLAKLADYSISFIQEAEPSVQIQDLHIGVLWLQPSTAQLRMYDGNVWSPIGFGRLSQDNLRFCGTINADTGLITTLNDRGREAGFEVGEAPPTATDALGGAYLLVEVAGSSISVVPATAFDAGDWCLCVNETEGWIRIDTITGGGGGSALLRLNDLLDVDINNPLPGDTLIYDSETNNWVNRTTTVDRLTLSPAFDGTTTSFTLSDTCKDQNNLTLSISGVIQEPGVDFTVTAGTNELRFASAPPTGSTYFVLSQQAIASSGGGGGGGTTLPPGSSENELLKWDNDLGAWTPSNIIEGGTY